MATINWHWYMTIESLGVVTRAEFGLCLGWCLYHNSVLKAFIILLWACSAHEQFRGKGRGEGKSGIESLPESFRFFLKFYSCQHFFLKPI